MSTGTYLRYYLVTSSCFLAFFFRGLRFLRMASGAKVARTEATRSGTYYSDPQGVPRDGEGKASS